MSDPFADAIARGKARPPHIFPPVPIADAIADYRDRRNLEHVTGPGGAPYDAASLAEIYDERVAELLELERAGWALVQWRWNRDEQVNRWHGYELEPDIAPAQAAYKAARADVYRAANDLEP